MHLRLIAFVMYATALIALCTGFYYFDKTNDLLKQYDLPTLPSLDDLGLGLIALFWYLVSIPVAGMWWFTGLVKRIIIKGNNICRRRVLVTLLVLGGGSHWVWERSHPLNAIEQLAAFAERYRDDDIIAFYIFKSSYYVAYYYFAFAKYLFPTKYEYNILNDPVAYYILFSGSIVIISTCLIGKTFDWIMQSGTTTQKTEADI